MASVSRRAFLKDAVSATLSENKVIPVDYKDPSNTVLPSHLAKTTTELNKYTGLFGDEEKLHLIRRTLFGVTKSDMDFFAVKTMDEAVDYLLNIPTVAPAPPLNNYGNNANTPDAEIPVGQTWVNAAANPQIEFARIDSFKAWWTSLMVNQERNLTEKDWIDHHSVSNFPNPCNEFTTISFNSKGGLIRICLYDTQGKLVDVVNEASFPEGKTETKISTANLPVGLYYYYIQQGNAQVMKNIVVSR